jgi:uncharacterized protein YkwD
VCIALALASAAPASAGASPEDALTDAINSARAAAGVAPLTPAGPLERSATRYAHALMRGDAFHHAPLDVGGRYTRAGETLEFHRGWALEPAQTVRRWLGSPTHRAVLLDRRSRRLGAGRARGRIHGVLSTIWVLRVGSP